MKKKITTMICVLAIATGLFSGCGTAAKGINSETAGSVADVSTTDTSAGAQTETEENLASEIQNKYSGASQKVTYTDGKFEVSRDQSFKVSFNFDAVAIGMDSYDQIAALYSDKDLTKEISSSYQWADDSHRSYLISPGSSPRTAIGKTGLDGTAPGYTEDGRFLFDKGEGKDWGNNGTMYLAQWVDLKTGEKLDKPIVTVITVKGELKTPDVRFTASDDGVGTFTWDDIPGASEYMVLEIPVYTNGSTGYATVIGQTQATAWADKAETDSISEETWQVNGRFKNYLISADDWLSQPMVDSYSSQYDPKDGPVKESTDCTNYYCVIAVSSTGTSMFSSMFSGDNIASLLPYTKATNMEKQSENGFSSYVSGVGMMPAYRWIVMCDGALSQRLVDYDFDHVSETQESRYVYEKEDMSDMHQETVNCLKVPYTVSGTPMTGVLTVEDYDTENWKTQLDSIKERQESLRSRTGTVDHGISVEESDNTGDTSSSSDTMDISGDTSSSAADTSGSTASTTSSEGIASTAVSESTASKDASGNVAKTDDQITANSALSEYLAVAMIGSAEKIDLTSFPESSDTQNVADAWQEATYQNPLVLGVSDAYLSSDHHTLNVVYQDDAQTRVKKQQQIRDAVKKINAQIISDGMTDIEKEFAINDYLCKNGTYDDAALADAEKNDFRKVDEKFNDSFTAYGILINGVGVCSSYAPAFKLLADDAGLNSIIVTGYLDGTEPHEWNRVNLNGNWDTVDVTNNDQDILSDAVLNLPYTALGSTFIQDKRYAIDSDLQNYISNDNDSEYYRVNGKYYSQDEIAQKFADQLKESNTVTLRTDYNLTDSQFYEIGSKVAKLTQNDNLGGCYWMGTIVLTSDASALSSSASSS